MITVFCYKATRWENGKPSKKDEHHIGFTDVIWKCGLTLGEIRIDEQSGKWCFYPMAIAPSTGLSHANLQTITDKLSSLNAASIPTKEGQKLRHRETQALRKEAAGSQARNRASLE